MMVLSIGRGGGIGNEDRRQNDWRKRSGRVAVAEGAHGARGDLAAGICEAWLRRSTPSRPPLGWRALLQQLGRWSGRMKAMCMWMVTTSRG